MPKPEFITFTGIDERTDLDHVRSLSLRFPIEWGILFSESKQGNAPRYPNIEFIQHAVEILAADPVVKLAAHICGVHSTKIMKGERPNVDLAGFDRTQINTTNPDSDRIVEFVSHCFPWLQAITQHRTLTFPQDDSVQWLYDCSGGRGDLPTGGWPPHPGEGRVVGYAGGLRAENIAEQNERINSKGRYWLDMESGIRTDDWLDLDKCEQVCKAIF